MIALREWFRNKKILRGDELLSCLVHGDKHDYTCSEHGRVESPGRVLKDGELYVVCTYCLRTSPDIPFAIYDGAKEIDDGTGFEGYCC